MGVVKEISGRCQRCYTCIRNCPVKAIAVERGDTRVIDELCISCGTCVRYCSQKAKQVEAHADEVLAALARKDREIVAMIAPSFPASFHDVKQKQVVAALRQLGFSKVMEVAYGAELVARDASRMLSDPTIKKPIISSSCPAVVGLIEKHFPELIPHLARTVSPMIALCRYLDSVEKERSVRVFIGPCIAKKEEIKDPQLAGIIDFALTFRELKAMFKARNIDVAVAPQEPMDPPAPGDGRVFPLMGGILKTAGLGTNILDPHIAIIEGRDDTLEFLRTFTDSQRKVDFPDFIDILFCRGCIDGVEIDSPLSHLERQRKVADLVRESRHLNPSALPEIDVTRTYSDKKRHLAAPNEQELREIMMLFGKFSADDELNCGSCGYPTCREKAIAVFRGFAEPEMCLPQIIKQLERTCEELQRSHEDLTKAQTDLVQSEKMASLGQLSAGVAHELNNPLGGILLFANMLRDKLMQLGRDGVSEELDIVVKEATRCRNIVRGLLDFARQNKLQKTAVGLADLIGEIISVERRALPENVKLIAEIDPLLPQCFIDPVQIRQALTNIVRNGVEAMADAGGTLSIKARVCIGHQNVEMTISDTGPGIPEENIKKLFTPFYTTKGVGRGTGLGLAITYGIIKMHKGTVRVESAVGKGSSFVINLPIDDEGRSLGGGRELIGG